MLSSDQKQVLKIVSQRLFQQEKDWFLMGTTGQCLQGIEVNPHDIDIIVRLEDLETIRGLFRAYAPTPIKKIRANHYKFDLVISNVNIEIIGEKEAKKYFNNKEEHLVRKNLDGFTIPCRKLKKEIEFYKKLGRNKKAKELKKFIRNRSKK